MASTRLAADGRRVVSSHPVQEAPTKFAIFFELIDGSVRSQQ